jgi:hypothetical protein
MRLSNLRTELRQSEFGQETALVADVESEKLGESTIWISVPSEYSNWLTTDRFDGFLLAILFYAMKNNEDIYVEGTVSKRLLRNLNNYVQSVMKSFTTYLNKINISAVETTNKVIPSATHIGTGFSGGVDSFCTVYERYACENDPEYKVDSLITLNIGHYGQTDGIAKQQIAYFKENFLFLSQCTKELGLPYVSVDTNFGWYIEENEFLRELRQFGPSFMAAVILSLQNRFAKYYIASNYSYLEMLQYAYKDRPVKKMNNMINGDYMENIFYHLLNTESLEIIVDGSQYKRTEKTERITKYPPSYKYIDFSGRNINVKNPINNWKVNRTLWALESIDKLELYSDSFDIDHWKKKDAFLYKCEQQILAHHASSHAKDNIDFAKANGKKVPLYFVAFLCFYFYIKPFHFTKKTIKVILLRFLGEERTDKIKMYLKKDYKR